MIDTLEHMSVRQRQIAVGRARDLYEKGYGVAEICKELNLPESTVRAIKHVIDEAEKNREK